MFFSSFVEKGGGGKGNGTERKEKREEPNRFTTIESALGKERKKRGEEGHRFPCGSVVEKVPT